MLCIHHVLCATPQGQGKGRSKSSKETNGSRGSRPPMQRAHSTGQTDPLLPVAGMQQPQFSQLGLPGSQPQSFFQVMRMIVQAGFSLDPLRKSFLANLRILGVVL